MNGFEGKDRSSFHVIGKGFLIALVTVFSSVGFVLGYFVGKSGTEESRSSYIDVVESVPLGQDTAIVREEENENHGRTEDPFRPARPETVAEKSPDAPRASDIVAVKKVPVRPRESGSNEKSVKVSASAEKERKAHTYELVYTVQLGAFKNETEAENFRTAYDKKGYKPYITVSRNKKNEKIYRIRSGEFRERKSAEILAMKLKKTEGLNTYVTFKNE